MEKETNVDKIIDSNDLDVNKNETSKIISFLDDVFIKNLKNKDNTSENLVRQLNKFMSFEDNNKALCNYLFKLSGDNYSFSTINFITQSHIKFDLEILLHKKLKIYGEVTIDFVVENPEKAAKLLILDSNKLLVNKVEYIDNNSVEKLSFVCIKSSHYETLGEMLVIEFTDEILEKIIKNQGLKLKINYFTLGCNKNNYYFPQSINLSNSPFGYTDAEPIGARSSFPCQDIPNKKFTFEAELLSLKPCMAYCSAQKIKDENIINSTFIKDDENYKGEFIKSYFKQQMPMPSYLVVFSCCEVEAYKLSERSNLYCVSNYIEQVKEHFIKEDIEKVIKEAENMIGMKFQFPEFNILILPYYNYFGMENPFLVYISKNSYKSKMLLYHELIHFWVGNLVTCKNWDCFWINEGITTYLETKLNYRLNKDEYDLVEIIESEKERVMYFVAGLNEGNHIKKLSLVTDFKHLDPGKFWSDLPYLKGCMLMRLIEDLIGEENLFFIIMNLVQDYKFKNIDSEELKCFFNSNIKELLDIKRIKSTKSYEEIISTISWDDWFHDETYYV